MHGYVTFYPVDPLYRPTVEELEELVQFMVAEGLLEFGSWTTWNRWSSSSGTNSWEPLGMVSQ